MRRSSRVTCLKWSRVRSSKGGYVVFRPKARQTYLLTFSRSVGLALDRFAGSIPVVPSAEKGAGLEGFFLALVGYHVPNSTSLDDVRRPYLW